MATKKTAKKPAAKSNDIVHIVTRYQRVVLPTGIVSVRPGDKIVNGTEIVRKG